LGSWPHSDFPQNSFVWEIGQIDSRPYKRETDLAFFFDLVVFFPSRYPAYPGAALTHKTPTGSSQQPTLEGPNTKTPTLEGPTLERLHQNTYPAAPTLHQNAYPGETYPGAHAIKVLIHTPYGGLPYTSHIQRPFLVVWCFVWCVLATLRLLVCGFHKRKGGLVRCQ
jgi:hypothetical protein